MQLCNYSNRLSVTMGQRWEILTLLKKTSPYFSFNPLKFGGRSECHAPVPRFFCELTPTPQYKTSFTANASSRSAISIPANMQGCRDGGNFPLV